MKKFSLFLALLLFASLSFAQNRGLRLVKPPIENPTNEKRKAVVIGMSDYGGNKSLNNTLNDADDMADVLTQLGFEVTLLKNNDLRNLETHLSNWYNTIERNDMAIFYFAGHGIEVSGGNYLIPIDAELNSEADVRYNALSVNKVLDNMDLKQVRFKLLILDACRDNPFTRGWSRSSGGNGLAQMRAPKSTLIAFAAAPGATAQDGGTHKLRNGVFTHYLKQEIVKEGVTIDNILNKVAGSVSNLTNDQQLPYKSGILTEDFYFKPKTNNGPIEVVKKYYYYVDSNGNKSNNQFDNMESAEREMKNKNLYGKIYSNSGESFIIEKPVRPDNPPQPLPNTGNISLYFAGFTFKQNPTANIYVDGILVGNGTLNQGFSVSFSENSIGKHNVRIEWDSVITTKTYSINTGFKKQFVFEYVKGGFGYEFKLNN